MTQSNTRASKEGYANGALELPGTGTMLELVENKDFSAQATSYTFTGLDGDTDCIYLLKYRIIKNTTSAMLVTAKPNGLATNQHSYSSFFGTATGTYDFAVLDIDRNGGATTGDVGSGELWIHAETGIARQFFVTEAQFRNAGVGVFQIEAVGYWSDTAANITSLEILCDQTNGIAAGSYLRLYRLKKA